VIIVFIYYYSLF